jgi:SP family general alpha glucoside:H+ symporter-like MFS transporter
VVFTVWEAIKSNKKAMFWSMIFSMSIIMEAYDTSLVPSFFALPAFQKRYGHYYPNIDQYQVSAPWQAGINNAATVGVVFGGFINGWASNRWGYKKVMLVSLFFINAFIFMPFFAPSLPILIVGEFLCGLPWGVFATTGPAYASEVCPLALRGYLTVYVNLCWATGQFIAGGVTKAYVNNTTKWSYKVPFAVQWIWPLPLFLIILFAPESPWWLVKQNRLDKAEKTIRSLASSSTEEIHGRISQMRHTILLEEEINNGYSYLDCFKGVNLRRTEICCLAFAGQMFSGAQFAYGPAYFFEQAGMSPDKSFAVGVRRYRTLVGGYCPVMDHAHLFRTPHYLRRRHHNHVLHPSHNRHHLCIHPWKYRRNVGTGIPLSSLAAGLFSNPRPHYVLHYLRDFGSSSASQTVVLSRNVYNIVAIISQQLEPYMMNPASWNWIGKTAFFWSGSALFTMVWSYFRLPECKVSLSS